MCSISLSLQRSTLADLDGVCAFYTEKFTQHNYLRPLDQLEKAIALGGVYSVHNSPSNEILALASVFQFSEQLYELGGCRVCTEIGGFGIHEILLRIRALHVLNHGPDSKAFCAINRANQRAIQNALSVGFIEDSSLPARIRYSVLAKTNIDPLLLSFPSNRTEELIAWSHQRPVPWMLRRVNRIDQDIQLAAVVPGTEVAAILASPGASNQRVSTASQSGHAEISA